MSKPGRRGCGGVTIDDVARAAGVSRMTVSRVMNKKEYGISGRTREAVLKAIKELNFSPNLAARNLAGGEATHVGLIYSNPSAAYLSQLLIGALSEAQKSGSRLVVEACDFAGEDQQSDLVRRLMAARVEGVILPSTISSSERILAEFAKSRVPVVTLGTMKADANALNVRVDDFAAAKQMTEYLIGLGHRRIGFIRGHAGHFASAERERGFRAAAKEARLQRDQIFFAEGQFTFRSGLDGAEQLLSADPAPTAIFACNDDMAAAAISMAHRRGMRVPEDLTVVGFDDTEPAVTIWPELTTVRQPVTAMAAVALDRLLAEIRDHRNGASSLSPDIVLDHELIVRKSSGPPRQALAQEQRAGPRKGQESEPRIQTPSTRQAPRTRFVPLEGRCGAP